MISHSFSACSFFAGAALEDKSLYAFSAAMRAF